MANAVTVNALRGILVHDERINASSFSETLSSYSEAGAHPGVPVPTRASPMVLESSGEMDQGTITIRTVRAGGVSSSPDGEIEPGAFAMQTNGLNWLGWNGPLVFSGWSPLHTFASGVGANQYGNLHTIHTDDGTMLTAAQRFSTAGATRALVILRTDASLTTTTIVVDTQPVGLVAYCPTLVRLPEGRLLLLSTKTLPAGQYTIRAWISTDDGSTWTRYADSVIRDELDATTVAPRRLRAAYSAGQILMMLAFRDTAATVADSFRQYASADEGASFALVQAVDNTTAANDYTGGVHDLIVTPSGSFLTVFCASSRTSYPANSAVLYKVLPSAWVAWQTVVTTTLSALSAPSASLTAGGQLSASTELCATRDEDGTVYVLSVDFGTNQQTQIARSTSDVFTDWTEVGVQSASVPNVPLNAGTGNEWVGGTVSAYNGTLRLVSQWDSGTWPGQIGCSAIAGYATACVPWSPATEVRSDSLLGSRLTWLPYWLPDSAGWTLATAGLPTTNLNAAGYLTITAPGTAVNTYTQAGPALTTNHTVSAFAEWAAITLRSEIRLSSSNGTNTYGIQVRYSGTTVDVLDANGGATLATTTVTAGLPIQIRAFLENNGAAGCNAVVYLSTSVGGLRTIRPATRICSVNTVSDSGVTAAATSVTWGQFSQVNPAESRWYSVGWNAAAGVSQLYNLALPSGLPGRPFSAYPQTLDFGTKVRAVAGPTLVDDEWTITPRHDYAVENVLVSEAPSPRQSWRSVDATQHVLAWVIESGAGAVTPLRGPLGAIYLGGCNFRTATLEGRNGAGAWISLGTVDMSAQSAPLRWTRTGTMIEPDAMSATTAGYFWPHGILRDARFIPDTTAAAGLTARRIAKSSEGNWSNQLGRRLRLELASTSGVGASGSNGAIVHRSGLLVWNNDPRYNAYRLTIPAQHTVEDYFEIGTMMLGHVMAFGRRYSWGRTMQTAPNTTLTTGRSGARRAQNFGPARRSVEFGWTDGTDVSAVRTGTTADYVLAAASGGGEAAATWYDAPLSVEGLVRELYGSATPVVYLPWIERKALGTVYQASHPDLMLYGRIVSDVSIETVQGEEWISTDGATGEVVRTSSIRIEEEV